MVKTLTYNSEQLQSKVISFLRFPLIIGVVLIHTQISTINGITGDMSAPAPFNGIFPLYESILYIFAQIITRIAVPLFFIFSGFLFFYRVESFSLQSYIAKIKKRVYTLLIPYLFWNILFIVFYNVLGWIFPGKIQIYIGQGYTIADWLMELWNSNGTGAPISLQFWFIRDLILVVIITPILYYSIKKLGYLFPLILGILWLIGLWPDIIFTIDALFFFSLGAYFSVTKRNFVELIKPHVISAGVLYLILVVLTFSTKSHEWVRYVKYMSILLGIAFAISLSAVLIQKNKWRDNALLANSSFFIYAYHIIAIPIIRRILFSIIPCTTDIHATVLYFTLTVIIAVMGILLYILFKKTLPQTTRLITGGR